MKKLILRTPEELRALDKLIATNLREIENLKDIEEEQLCRPYTTEEASAVFLLQLLVRLHYELEIEVTVKGYTVTLISPGGHPRPPITEKTFPFAIASAVMRGLGWKITEPKTDVLDSRIIRKRL